MTFGEKLQKLRQQAGMSQDALAEKLHVSRQAVSRWERDETMPETDKVVALADLFSVTTDELLRPSAQPVQPPRQGGQKRDWVEQLTHLVKTKGYLLGWLLVLWGAGDLLGTLSAVLMVNGFFSHPFGAVMEGWADITSMAGMVAGVIWLPILYGIVKVTAGILVLHFGKRAAEKEKR